MRKEFVPISLLLILGCTTTTGPVSPAAPAAHSEFKNLEVLPRNITRDELMTVMRSFNRGLGVRCDHCHVVTATTPQQQFDFPADTKETKRAARVMLQMTMQINGEWLDRVEAAEHGTTVAQARAARAAENAGMRVTCWTCHRGKPEPETPPAPPQS